MKELIQYSKKDIETLTRKRTNEVKIGEKVFVFNTDQNWETELENVSCRYVLIGIPEDIGVRANFGRGGTHSAWKPALDSFLSQQSNHFLKGEDVCILGHVFVDDLMEQTAELNVKVKSDLDQLRKLVSIVDDRVSRIISKIVKVGKIPIIIGGGHNNSYPIIKGTSQATEKKLNVINCDPHTDFRPLEGRHSGNGFSYAFHENFIDRYSVFCIHEQYNTASVLQRFNTDREHLFFTRYEDVFVRESQNFSAALLQNLGFVKSNHCGVELDLDAITNVPSSAKTSSGISPVQARQYAYQCGKHLKPLYFHIAEGAPILSHIKADNKTGKLIAYLISDFIKGIADGCD